MRNGVHLRRRRSRDTVRVTMLGLLALALVVASAAARPNARARADLVVAAVSNPPASVVPGATLPAGFTVANRGKTRAGRSTARAYLSRDSRVGRGDLLLGAASVGPLKPGKTTRRSSAFKAPATLAAGSWFVIV